MEYHAILDVLGMTQADIADLFGYKSTQTMWSSSPWRDGRIKAIVETLFDAFVRNNPKLTEAEVEKREAGTPFLLELARRSGVDLEHFRQLRTYLESQASPDNPEDRDIVDAEGKEWRRVLRLAGLI